MKTKINDILVPGNMQPWTDVCSQLNSLLRGWSAYFCYGTRNRSYRAVDHHVCERVRHFLSRRHKVPSRGTERFPSDLIFRRTAGACTGRRPCLSVDGPASSGQCLSRKPPRRAAAVRDPPVRPPIPPRRPLSRTHPPRGSARLLRLAHRPLRLGQQPEDPCGEILRGRAEVTGADVPEHVGQVPFSIDRVRRDDHGPEAREAAPRAASVAARDRARLVRQWLRVPAPRWRPHQAGRQAACRPPRPRSRRCRRHPAVRHR